MIKNFSKIEVIDYIIYLLFDKCVFSEIGDFGVCIARRIFCTEKKYALNIFRLDMLLKILPNHTYSQKTMSHFGCPLASF